MLSPLWPTRQSQSSPSVSKASQPSIASPHQPQFGAAFPVVRKINPLNKANWLYLMQLTFATRMATATARILLNYPTVLKGVTFNEKVKQNFNDKDQMLAFFERSFIEVFDTFGFIAVLHLGMDLLAKGLQLGMRKKLGYPKDAAAKLMEHKPLAELLPDKGNRKAVVEAFNKAWHGVYGEESNLVATIIAKASNADKVGDAFKKNVAGLLSPEKAEAAWKLAYEAPVFRNFIERTNFAAVGTIAFTVLVIGPVVAGLGVQYVNDKIYSNLVRPFAEMLVKNKQSQTAAELAVAQTAAHSGGQG